MDRIGAIDFTFLEKITRGVLASVFSLANEGPQNMEK
jgi:hypothetical protein